MACTGVRIVLILLFYIDTMFLNPFNTTAATTAGESLAKIAIETVPVTLKSTEIKHAKKVKSALLKMTQQIEWLKLQHKFNFFQRAKLGNTLQWKLKDAGYDDVYIKELTQWVLMRLN